MFLGENWTERMRDGKKQRERETEKEEKEEIKKTSKIKSPDESDIRFYNQIT